MGVNGYTGQLIGPFIANDELYDKIVAAAAYPVNYVSHIGIQSDVKNYVYINNKEVRNWIDKNIDVTINAIRIIKIIITIATFFILSSYTAVRCFLYFLIF